MIAADDAARTVDATGTEATCAPRDGGRELTLREVPLRRTVELVRIDLPAESMVPLLERGLVPGCRMCPLRRSPTGDPILLVDGMVIALRREMADCLCVRDAGPDMARS
ncbi:MAG TPA: FeoA family protein [Longimicrobiales bacterium]